MQFQVPQFIDLKPKIVGPLTLTQFLYLAAAAIPSFILFFAISFWLWIPIALALSIAAAALAFGKFNGQSLPKVALSIFNYFWKPRFYLWRRVEEPAPLPHLPKLPGLKKEISENNEPSRMREALEQMTASPTAPLKNLLLKLTTTRHPIAQREKESKMAKFLDVFDVPKNEYETIRRTSGERKVARRIDYR